MTKQEFCAFGATCGLKVKWGCRTLKLNFGQGSSKYWIGVSSFLKWTADKSDMIEKPTMVVRNIFDLTKPIVQANYNYGKPFVPIVELAKIANIVPDIQSSDTKILKSAIWIDGYELHFIDADFALFNSGGDEIGVGNQLQLFKQLMVWHFDLITEKCDKVYVTEYFDPYK